MPGTAAFEGVGVPPGVALSKARPLSTVELREGMVAPAGDWGRWCLTVCDDTRACCVCLLGMATSGAWALCSCLRHQTTRTERTHGPSYTRCHVYLCCGAWAIGGYPRSSASGSVVSEGASVPAVRIKCLNRAQGLRLSQQRKRREHSHVMWTAATLYMQ